MKGYFGAICFLVCVAAQGRSADGERDYSEGLRFLRESKPKEAIVAFDRAVRANARKADYHVGRALALNMIGRYDQALLAVDEALELDPKHANGLSTRGDICNHFGRFAQAVRHYDKAIALAHDNDLRDHIRANRTQSVRNQNDVFRGIVRPNADDLPKLAREGPQRPDPIKFWKSIGRVEPLTMTKEERVGDRIRKTTLTLSCVRLDMRLPGGPIPVFLPLEDGDVFYAKVKIACEPRIAILLGGIDTAGLRDASVRKYVEWLYFKYDRVP